MRKRIAAYLMIFAAAFPILALALIAAHREETAVSLPQVVQINSGCSGFIADFGFIVTARHCVDDAYGHTELQDIKFYDGLHAMFTTAVVGKDLDYRDYAVLIGDTRGIKPLEFANRLPEEGDLCAHVGHGGASAQQLLIYCQVGAINGWYDGYIKLYSNAIPGDSGSAVMNEAGEVFGILVRSRYPVPVALAVKASYAKMAIVKLKHGK